MGCDYFFDDKGQFKIELHYEHGDDDYRNEYVTIHGKPNGKIYEDILKGSCR